MCSLTVGALGWIEPLGFFLAVAGCRPWNAWVILEEISTDKVENFRGVMEESVRGPLLIYLGEVMVSFTGHDGSESVTSSMSLDPGSTAEVLEGSASVTPHESAENNGSTELVAGQLKAGRKKLLLSLIPGHAPVFVCEKQYDPVLRRRTLCAHRVEVKDRSPRGPTGCFILAKGRQGRINGGTSQAPSSIPATDFYGPFVATNEDEEHVGEDAYDSILNLKAPDCTEVLRIMMGDRYYTEVSEEFRNVASLESPEFSILLTAMNNTAYDEAADDGYYCVNKVLLKLSGWL